MDALIMLEGHTVDAFLEYMAKTWARTNERDDVYRLRIGVDFDGIKVKVNEEVWTLPLGEVKTWS